MKNQVRLTKQQLDIICNSFRENFLSNDHLWIFGSRVDLQQKGGDIDLYIESNINEPKDVVKAKTKFITSLQKMLGEQKIDVIINFDNGNLPIYQVAKTEGVILL